MAGRNRMPRHPADNHGFRDGPRPMLNRGPGPLPVYPVALEEEVDFQHRENQKIAAENRHLLDENVNLEREVVAAKDEIQRLEEFISKLRGDNDIKFRNLIERGLKLEADLRAAEPLREEVMHLRAEAKKLNVMRQDLTGQVQSLSQDVSRLRSENKQLSAMRADVDGIRKELTEARRALEYEKKANEEQMEQKEVMEKNLMSMAREIEKLRAEHVSMDRRGHGLGVAGSSGYGSGTGGSGYGSGMGGSGYGSGTVGSGYGGSGYGSGTVGSASGYGSSTVGSASGYGSSTGGSGYGMYSSLSEMRYPDVGSPADGYGAWGPYNKRSRR